MRNIKIQKDTPLRPTPEVKDTTNYSKKEKKQMKAKSVRFNPPTLDEYYSVEHEGGKSPSIGF
jgi:hypothetical protein